jgi:hypothetical protein
MSILPTGCRVADPAAGRRPPIGSPAGGGRTAQRRRSYLPRLVAPLRQDLRAGRLRIRRRTTCPSGISTRICSPGRHSRSSSSTTARHAPPAAATLRPDAPTMVPQHGSTLRGTAVHATRCGRRILGLARGVEPRHLSPRIEILLVVLLRARRELDMAGPRHLRPRGLPARHPLLAVRPRPGLGKAAPARCGGRACHRRFLQLREYTPTGHDQTGMPPDDPAPAPPRYPPIRMTAMPAGALHSSPAPVTSVDSTFVWPAPMPPPTPRPRPPTTAIAAPPGRRRPHPPARRSPRGRPHPSAGRARHPAS